MKSDQGLKVQLIVLFASCMLTSLSMSQLAYRGGTKTLLSFDNIDSQVRNGIADRVWTDNVTIEGWWGRAGDATADTFHLSHGSNPAGGLQVYVNAATNEPIALGSLVNTKVQNAVMAVGIKNETGSSIDRVVISYEQVQWYGGTGAMVDIRRAWYGLGGDGMSGVSWEKCPELDMKNFVSDKGGLFEPITLERQGVLTDLDWQPEETLWIRWIDIRVDGGNAGAGLTQLEISEE
ncbi:hypothetical protein ACWPKS_12525 [Coraliomargarita sp. W4R72]